MLGKVGCGGFEDSCGDGPKRLGLSLEFFILAGDCKPDSVGREKLDW